MAVLIAPGNERSGYKVLLTTEQHQTLQETVEAYKTIKGFQGVLVSYDSIRTMGDVLAVMVTAFAKSYAKSNDVAAAFRSAQRKIKIAKVSGTSPRVTVKFYLSDDIHTLLRSSADIAGMEAPDFVEFLLFGTERIRKNPSKKRASIAQVIRISLDADEATIVDAAISLECGETANPHTAAKKKLIDWATSVLEPHFNELADNTGKGD